jgi:hypothetical protein
MKWAVGVLAFVLSIAGSLFQQTLVADDLRVLTGPQWVGSLTYRDYRSDKMISIPSTLTVAETSSENLSWDFAYQYPAEPKANGTKTVVIRDEGRMLSDERVVERRQLATNLLKIVTEKKGKDNDRDALLRFTYLISKKSFSITKEVQYKGSIDFLARNQYSWNR